MSRLVNLSDEVYSALTSLKKAKNASYSEVIAELLEHKEPKKTVTWEGMIKNQVERDKKSKRKKEKIDHDLAAYGVSRDSS